MLKVQWFSHKAEGPHSYRIPVKPILQNTARQMPSDHLSEIYANALNGERALVDRPQKILLGNQGAFKKSSEKVAHYLRKNDKPDFFGKVVCGPFAVPAS